jgi:cellulose synthase/poly-beta-1,6-N-acetylglucosamine synthase-like glycosyltransferase
MISYIILYEYLVKSLSIAMINITIGIPSFNEEKNILRLLHSLSASNRKGFIISEVIISDDSDDCTPELVKTFSIQNPCLNIKYIHHSTRRGTALAWNEIFENANGAIIVLYDADTIPDRKCTNELVQYVEGKIGLCASNPEPVGESCLVNRATIFISRWLRSIRLRGLSQYTVMGRSLAIRTDIAKKIRLPESIIAVDLYLQCKVIENGLDIFYNDNAIVYFSPPKTMSDFASQIIRASNGHKQIKDYIKKFSFQLSSRVALVEILRNLICDPVGALSVAICYVVLPYYRSKVKDLNSVRWHVAASTKMLDSGLDKTSA